MENLVRSATTSSPDIAFDAVSGRLSMRGESYPENTFEFYAPVVGWLREWLVNRTEPVSLELEISYLNTGSIKCLMDMFDLLDAHHQAGRPAQVVWRYHVSNPRALETAEEFAEDLSLPFHIERTDS